MDGRGMAVAITLGLFLATIGPGSVVAAEPVATIGETDLTPDDVLLRVKLAPDGSATWAVEYRVRLDDENTTAAFESLQADIEANASRFTEPFATRMGATAATAADETRREMSIRNVTVEATRRQLPQGYGVLTYRFTWVGFAAANKTTLRAGDALTGFFLDEGTTLLLAWPAEYRATTIAPLPDEQRNRAVVWTGPVDFGPGEPSLVLERYSSEKVGTTEVSGSPGGGTKGGVRSIWLALTAVSLGVLGVAGWLVRRRRGPSSVPASDVTTEQDESDETDDGSSTDLSSELLSNEERVLMLLRERGGRMKQQEVTEALGWTAAKTSQVVTAMREDGRVESFRLGRENVLVLPDDETT